MSDKDEDLSTTQLLNNGTRGTMSDDSVTVAEEKNNGGAKLVSKSSVSSEQSDQFGDDEENECEENDEEEVDDNPVPVDTGWAWFVLLGAVLEMTLLIGMLKSAGIMFVAFQERFNSTSSMTSLLSTVQNAVYSVFALLTTTLGLKITSGRKLLFCGSILTCIAYIITSRATDVRVLLFSHGILMGIGLSFIQPIVLTTLSKYFNKRRGFANSIAVSGGSLGGLIFAPLMTALFENYGYQGCLLILSGLLLNVCVTGALFRPLSFYTKRSNKHLLKKNPKNLSESKVNEISLKKDKNNIKEPEKTGVGDRSVAQIIFARQLSRQSGHGPVVSSLLADDKSIIVTKGKADHWITNPNSSNVVNENSPSLTRRQRTTTESSVSRVVDMLSLSKYSSSEYIVGSMMDIPGLLEPESDDDDIDDSDSKKSRKTTRKLLDMLKAFPSHFDFKLFKNPIFLTLQTASFLLCSGNALCTIYIAPHAKETGVSADDVANIVSVFSGIDLCSRIIVAFISDRGWVRRSTLVGLSVMVVSLTAQLLRFYTNLSLLFLYAVILGLCSGVYFSLFAVVIVDYMTIGKLQSTLGFTTLFHGSGIAITFYVVGYLRDVTGSYVIPFHLLGSMSFIGGILMFLLPTVERIHKNRQKRLETNQPEV